MGKRLEREGCEGFGTSGTLEVGGRLEHACFILYKKKVAEATVVGALDRSAQRLQPLKRLFVCLLLCWLGSRFKWQPLVTHTFTSHSCRSYIVRLSVSYVNFAYLFCEGK